MELGFDDLALTTNGMELAGMASELAAAGLRRVNVSCDSLRADRFAPSAAEGAWPPSSTPWTRPRRRLGPLKVNVVLLRGHNDDEILEFADFARRTGRVVRFIEFMPLDADGAWSRDRLVPGREVFDRIIGVWPLVPVEPAAVAPAERFRFVDGCGEIGLISSVTQPFCGTCDRLRLTADGALRNCLFSDRRDAPCATCCGGAPKTRSWPSPSVRPSGPNSLVTGSTSLGFSDRPDPCR